METKDPKTMDAKDLKVQAFDFERQMEFCQAQLKIIFQELASRQNNKKVEQPKAEVPKVVKNIE